MHTWNTMMSYGATARALDDDTLHDQKEDVLQIVNWLLGEESETEDDDPVLLMWAGYEYALCIYGMFMGMEWMRRGNTDEVFWALGRITRELGVSYEAPPWLRDKDVLRSHRSALMRFDKHYRKTWRGTPINLPILWPVILFDENDEPSGYELRISSTAKKDSKLKLPPKLRERIANL